MKIEVDCAIATTPIIMGDWWWDPQNPESPPRPPQVEFICPQGTRAIVMLAQDQVDYWQTGGIECQMVLEDNSESPWQAYRSTNLGGVENLGIYDGQYDYPLGGGLLTANQPIKRLRMRYEHEVLQHPNASYNTEIIYLAYLTANNVGS